MKPGVAPLDWKQFPGTIYPFLTAISEKGTRYIVKLTPRGVTVAFIENNGQDVKSLEEGKELCEYHHQKEALCDQNTDQ